MKNDKIIFPDYYKDFKCKADRCSENCCLGWEIDIDKETLGRYNSLCGALGEKIRKNIKSSDGISHFVMKNGRCPMLNEQNLCEIIISLGEGAICDICREHPRFYSELSGVTLGGVGMSCEAAAELIIKQKNPSLYGNILPLLDEDDEDFEASALIASALFDSENILRSSELSDNEKLALALLCVRKAENGISELYFGKDEEGAKEKIALPDGIFDNSFSEALAKEILLVKDKILSLEFMGDELPKRISLADGRKAHEMWNYSSGFRRVILNCLGYLIARYLPKADGDFLPSEFISASITALCLLYSECKAKDLDVKNNEDQEALEKMIRTAVLFSSEIEYSEENVEKLHIREE